MVVINTALIIAAYLLGSISAAIVVCKLMSLPDPRLQGSGNPGTTNVLRIGGKKAAAITLLGDALKGFAPTLAAQLISSDPRVCAATALAAVLGHMFPVFFKFQGGKGVATGLGVLLGIAWPVGLAALATWLLMAKVFKISSLSALTAAMLTPAYAWWLAPHVEYFWLALILSLLLLWRHRSNIQNLLSGKEGKIGAR